MSQGVIIGLKNQIGRLEADNRRLNEGLAVIRDVLRRSRESRTEAGDQVYRWVSDSVDRLLRGDAIARPR